MAESRKRKCHARFRYTHSDHRFAAYAVLQYLLQVLLAAARNDTTKMSLETVQASFEKIFDSPFAGDQITVIWHAGEPLVMPVSYYERAFRLIEKLRPESVQIHHSFQTNGTLVTK